MKNTAEFAKRQGRKAPKSVLQHYCISSLRLSRCKHSDYNHISCLPFCLCLRLCRCFHLFSFLRLFLCLHLFHSSPLSQSLFFLFFFFSLCLRPYPCSFSFLHCPSCRHCSKRFRRFDPRPPSPSRLHLPSAILSAISFSSRHCALVIILFSI